MNRQRFAALLVLLALAAAAPAGADSYLKIPPGANYTYGDIRNVANSLASDDVYVFMPPDDQSNGNHAIGNRQFANGFSEVNHGYLQDLQFGVEYHLYPFRFGVNTAAPPTGWSGADYFEGYYSTNNGSSWTSGFFPDAARPAVTSAEVSLTPSDGANDATYVLSFPTQTALNTWALVYANLRADLCWYKADTATTITHSDGYDATDYALPTPLRGVYVDYIFINALVKLTVTGTTLVPATSVQGTDDVPRLLLTLKRFSNSNFDLRAIKVAITGTCAATDISRVSLWRDVDASGTLTAADTLVGMTTAVILAGTTIAGTGADPVLIDDIPHNSKWILTVGLKDTATLTKTVGMSLTDQTFVTPRYAIDAVASNQDRTDAGTAGNPDPNPLWPIATASTFAIAQRATLTTTIQTQPSPLSLAMGAPFTITFNVKNANGAGTAINVRPDPPVVTSLSGGASAVTSTFPTPVTLAGNASANFTYTFYPTKDGTLNIKASASGTDQSSGKPVSSAASAASSTVTVTPSTQAVLQFTDFNISPDTVSNDGQRMTIEITVKNASTVDATNVGIYRNTAAETPWVLEPTLTGTATATNQTGSLASLTLVAGASATWEFLYDAGGIGTVAFSAKAFGSNTAKVVSSSPLPTTIVAQATATNQSLTSSPAPNITRNTAFTVLYTVKNNGTAAALGVTPTALTLVPVTAGSPDPVEISGPSPTSFDLAAGETKSFSWSYNANNGTTIGTYEVQCSAGYTDANSGKSRNGGTLLSSPFGTTNSIVPLARRTTTASVQKYITYSDDSQYYAIDNNNNLYAYNTAGAQKWTVALGFTVPGDTFYVSTEGGSNVIWIGNNAGRVYSIEDTGTGATGYWTPAIADSWCSLGTASSVTTGPVVWDDYIYCAAGTRLAKRTKLNGTYPIGWTDYEFPANVTTAPSVDNNYIYVGLNNGKVYAINATSGNLQSASAAIGAGGAVQGDPFIALGQVYVANNNGRIVRFGNPANLTASVTSVDLDGATNSTMSDLWIGLDLDFIYLTDTATKIYQLNYATLAQTATSPWTRANQTLYGPIELGGLVYVNSATSTTTGNVYVISKATGANLATWNAGLPFALPYPSRTPTTLDAWNNVFLVGRDYNAGDQNTVYMFGIPNP